VAFKDMKWVRTLIFTTPSYRKQVVKQVLEGIKKYKTKYQKKRDKKGESLDYSWDKGAPNKEAVEFGQLLENNKDFKLIGITPQIMYIKTTGNKKQLECIFRHQFGSPVLLYKYKDLPILILAGGAIRLDNSVVAEIGENHYANVSEGITG
jgi:hypothetical protein